MCPHYAHHKVKEKTTQTGNGVMFDVTSYPACRSVGPESGLSSLVCVFPEK